MGTFRGLAAKAIAFCILLIAYTAEFSPTIFGGSDVHGTLRKVFAPTELTGSLVEKYKNNGYQNPIPEDIARDSVDSLPLPLQVVEQYKRWHSVEALREDPHNRTFVIGYYACPVSAGNRLHEFVNDLIFAMLTNRTLLWRYIDENAYDDIRHSQPNWFPCTNLNTEKDCANMLARAPWIPSFDEWSKQVNLTTFDIVYIPQGKMIATLLTDSAYLLEYNEKVLAFPRYFQSFSLIDLPKIEMSGIYKQLLSLGESVLNGMLLREMFDFSDAVKDSVFQSDTNDDNHHEDRHHLLQDVSGSRRLDNTYTVSIHSRHPFNEDDGCDITDDIECLQQVLDQRLPSHTQCQIWVLADRECTAPSLQTWLMQQETSNKNYNCTVEVANHDGASSSHMSEHGPFAGIGFFEDLALSAAHTRHAIVGSSDDAGVRSSTRLLLELVEFHRAMEAWELGQDVLSLSPTSSLPKLDPVHQCLMFRPHPIQHLIHTGVIKRSDAQNAPPVCDRRRRRWRS